MRLDRRIQSIKLEGRSGTISLGVSRAGGGHGKVPEFDALPTSELGWEASNQRAKSTFRANSPMTEEVNPSSIILPLT